MAAARSPLFILILVVYLVAGGLYAFLTPAWQAPDEPAHYNYVRALTTRTGFPELKAHCYNQTYLNELTSRRFPPEMSVNNICYEFHQPPLYYLLGMPVFVLSGGYLPVLRFLSMALLGGGVVVLAFFIGQTIFPASPTMAYGTMAFVAFVPMHLAILSSINNDVLAELILAAILLVLTQRLIPSVQSNHKQRFFDNDWFLGILLGLGLGTKTTIYIAVPLVAIVLWWTSAKETPEHGDTVRDWHKLTRQAAIIFGVALLIVLPWFVRNATIYGNLDILGLGRHGQIVVGQLRAADYLAEVGWLAYLGDFTTTTFHSFWGQFGWMAVPMDGRSYLLLTLLTLMALGGLFGFWWTVHSPQSPQGVAPAYELSIHQRRALALMGIAIGLTALVYLGYNVAFVQFQGRYLYPALIPLGIFFTLGLHEALLLRWKWWLVGGLGIAFACVMVASLLKGDFDKWAVVFTGLVLLLASGRVLLAHYRPIPTAWLMTACYAALGFLALVSPFWFIVPHLSP